jgi:hypothetical protein
MLGRHTMAWGTALLGRLNLGGWSLWPSSRQAPLLLSARDSADGGHLAVGYRLDGSEVFSTPVAQRCHAIVQHPRLPMALFVARRPGTECYSLDLRDGRLLQTLSSPANRHVYGHAVIHASGDWLYLTENDTSDPGRGVIGVYRLQGETWQRHAELPSHGIGPHELAWLPDGETLVVANGGIRTEAESRVEMNLHAMQPSLVLMRRDGALISQETLGQSMNSIRHLAVAADGTVLASQQFMGDAEELAELLAIKRPGQPFEAFPVAAAQLREMRHYTASVAVHSELRLVALTAPRADRLFIWDLDSAVLRLEAPLADCAGVAAVSEGFVVSSGQGRCRLYDCHGEVPKGSPLTLPGGLWDNHLQVV